LVEERIRILRESGTILQREFNGSVQRLIEAAGGSALRLVDILVELFPSFRDECLYKSHVVHIRKRAQIFVADVWACFGYTQWQDIGEITMFADYRVPQLLEHLGCIEYADSLKRKLQAKELINHGSAEEIEIRCSSIVAVERLCQHIHGHVVNPITIDFFLWDLAKEEEAKQTPTLPFHRTRCIYY